MNTLMKLAMIALALTACGNSGGGGGDDGGSGAVGAPGPFFSVPEFFNHDVSGVSKGSQSDSMIASLRAAGGWGNGDKLQIDFSFDVLAADSDTPHQAFMKNDDFYYPDCDFTEVPIPANGNVEGEDGYACTQDGDCHLLVFDQDAKKLYEMFRANISGGDFDGGCLIVWDTTHDYGKTGRGPQCSSADAAGFPIAPLLFTADEVAAGKIDHAIRLILPNNRPRANMWVAPASHAGGGTSGADSSPAYGMHLRLRADFDLDTLPSEGAKVVARAMQKYGMYHADGGNIALTAQSDRYSTAKWDDVLDAHDLASIALEDFDVIDEGTPVELTNDCQR